jgi:chorismate synthase
VESQLASLLFSIPAVKGVEFGSGFELSSLCGSEANDPFRIRDGKIVTESNHNGGILGGITTGMPIVFRCGFKPTPSIAKEQLTVDKDFQERKITIAGRHDPCIVPRIIPVVEAMAAIVLADMALLNRCARIG